MTARHPDRPDYVLIHNDGTPLTATEEDKFWRQIDLITAAYGWLAFLSAVGLSALVVWGIGVLR